MDRMVRSSHNLSQRAINVLFHLFQIIHRPPNARELRFELLDPFPNICAIKQNDV